MKFTKPTETAKTAIDWMAARQWIEKGLEYDLRDTLKSGKHYDAWCRKYNEEPATDSREQYARYMAAEDGHAQRPDYRDYWHFLVRRCDIHNDRIVMIGSDLLESCEPWQADITQAFIAEFGDECEYWVEW